MKELNLIPEHIIVKYDGKYPCLCMGKLIVIIDGVEYDFGNGAIESGGYCGFSNDYSESFVEEGDWYWSCDRVIPEGYNLNWDKYVINTINEVVSKGCCGGCL